MTNSKATLFKKILKVMEEVKHVPKNGYNSFHKYNYVTEADMVDFVRPLLVKNGLAFFSSVKSQEKQGEFARVEMEFTLADAETGECLTSIYWGEGQDKGDKAFYKAFTGATKYFLMKTFLIPTGDDPEADTSTDERNAKNQNQKPQQNKQPNNGNQQKQLITAHQIAEITRLFNELELLGADVPKMKNLLQRDFGEISTMDKMPKDKANKIITRLHEWKESKKEQATG